MKDYLKMKHIRTGKEVSCVKLKKSGETYIVTVDDTVYYKSPNNLFAVQKFNEI